MRLFHLYFVVFFVDNHCVKLVHEYQAVEPLIHVVRKATDLKASHAATGVLRNLALAGIPFMALDYQGNRSFYTL
jgi:hypothetical protein